MVAKLETIEKNMKEEDDNQSVTSADLNTKIPSPEVIQRSRQTNKRVTLNVGGVR